MKAPRVRWEIGDVPSTVPREAVQEAARVELERLLAERGMPAWLSDVRETDGFEAAGQNSAEPMEGTGLGRTIAKAVHGGPRE